MTKQRLSLKICFAIVCALLISSGNVHAQRAKAESEGDNTKTKQAEAVSKEVYDQITKAQELVEAEDYQGALRILNRLYNPDKLTEYEQGNVLNYIGFVHYNMGDVPKALEVYERMIAIPSLEAQLLKSTTYTLAQLNMMEENYDRTLQLLENWFKMETNPQPESFILMAQVYYQLQNYEAMIPQIERGMQVAREKDKEIKEDWWVLLNFAYFQQENYAKVRDIQKTLLETWPKKNYWFSLAGAFTELGEDDNLIAAYDAAYTQGMLEKESEFVTMAQLYLQREVPYKAAKVLTEEMESGAITESARNYRLLSQAWMLSQEDLKAVPALQKAANLSDDGELDVRLGNTYLNLAEYAECAKAVRAGLRKGGLKNPDNAQISLGMCLYNLREYNDAIQSFEAAAKVSKSRKIANQWITVIRADIERNRQIRLAEQAARKKREEVQERAAKRERV
jgi:tetratricopeptide (TPR) repeat protein